MAELCERCESLNIADLFEPMSGNQIIDSKATITLGQINQEWTNSPCPLCQFFLSMIDNPNDTTQYGVYKGAYQFRGKKPPTGCLAVKGLDDPYIKSQSLESPRIYCSIAPETPLLIDDKVDYSILKTWCDHFQKTAPPNPEIKPLRVMDCSTRTVVPYTGNVYVALSYVWGVSPSDELPETIRDSMTVVLKLGFRYLWVDRYCIDQSNQVEFVSQINHMDDIYRGAVATIITAAGTDANYGLPGVGKRKRTKQPSIKIGEYFLFSDMTDPRRLVRESVWMTRAWTYQEAVFTKNWIVFTDEQVFFQRSNTEYSHQERGWQVSCEMHPEGGLGMLNPDCPLQKIFDDSANTGGLHEQIYRYTSRKLTFQTDALNGLLGILKRYGTGPYPINQYFGVPILGPLEVYRLVSPRSEIRQWTLTEAFLVGLCWKASPGLRRSLFPSWSWIEWLTLYEKPVQSIRTHGLSNESEVKVGLFVWQAGELVDWEKACTLQGTLPRTLVFQAPTTTLRIGQWSKEGDICDENPAWSGAWCAIVADAECEVQIGVDLLETSHAEVKCIFLRLLPLERIKTAQDLKPLDVLCFGLLVVEEDEGTTRVGTLELRLQTYCVRWKKRPFHSRAESGSEGDQNCSECRERAILLLTQRMKDERVEVV